MSLLTTNLIDGPCPECGASWRGAPIPVQHLLAGMYGEWELGDAPRYFSRLVGIEFSYDHPEHYDGVSRWKCPDCGVEWNRFTGERVNGVAA